MSSADPVTDPPTERKKSLWRRLGLGSMLFSLMFAAVMGAAIYVLIGRPVMAPDWLRDRIEIRAGEALGAASLRFDALDLVVEDSTKPRVRMTNVQLLNDAGVEIVGFSEMRIGLSLTDLVQGTFRPTEIGVTGVFAKLRREIDGSVILSGGLDLGAPSQQADTFAKLIEGIDDLVSIPGLSAMTEADVQALTLQIEDVRSARAWTVDGGRMRLIRDGDVLRITSDLALLSGGQGVATLEANYEGRVGASAATFGVLVNDVDAGDIAVLAPAFEWLDVLRAPISGAVRGVFGVDGTLAPINVALNIGEGVIQPTDATRPVPFRSARSYFSYDPEGTVLLFDELSVDSAWITAQIDGQAVLGIDERGGLDDLVGQFRATSLSANPDALYPEPIQMEAAQLDFRLSLDPFRLDIGQALFQDKGQDLIARGALMADPDGWSYELDAQMEAMMPDRLLELWPERYAPKARKWVLENLFEGQMRDLDLALRDTPTGAVVAYTSFAYEDAKVRYLKTLPPVEEARGSASLLDGRFVVSVDQGHVTAPQGGRIDVSGSSFIIPDVRARDEVPAVVRLETDGTVTAGLSLLDMPPLNVMERAGLSPTIADGRIAAAGTLAFAMKKGLKPKDVQYDATGTARDVLSTSLIEGRRLSADRLTVVASQTGVEVAGPGTLDGVPFDVTWAQPLGQGPQPSTVRGSIELSERTIDAFDLGLPAGLVSGRGSGDIEITLPVGEAAPSFALSSNLRGVRLSSPPLGWSKPAGSPAALSLSGALGPAPRVDRLVLDAPGLQAEGAITATPGAGLERASFSAVRVGNWMNGPVDLVGRGRGVPPAVVVRGGTLDLREADFGGSGSGTGGQQGGGPLSLTLDRLQITDTIALIGVSGEFNMSNGLDGTFTARVNAGTPIRGQVLPQGGRSAIRITANDAGGVAASARILKQARGGTLDLTLLPVGAAGFDGTLSIKETRVQDAPAIAALLNALSVVGLLEQMGGSGIHFQDVNAAFRLTPSTMTLTQASATGPSMGLSMDGVYDVAGGRLNMQGVISPLFLINGIGSIFTRRGEGLIGFNYTLRGPAADPRVQVNPLSALTPGLFREIFRAPPPDLPRVEGETPAPVVPEAFAPVDPGPSDAERRRQERQQRVDER
ncbi:AsmA-like C-terminal region-containing protein [Tateyamaria omphalii]|uniref:AsmA-like C-terminal region-containing protein n=1 Tax=Tateyamaria omphalii TaxID=299262 RepID=UPI001C9944DD|nr:AsmA-like C-terminal region-containing protein [Tateyamaria omphalii]MBY5932941.1 AsmA-like C-terminal region-containing protein [Tateyamaria omphalii]